MKKKYLLIVFSCCLSIYTAAQNVGINTTEPSGKLHVAGNLVVSEETLKPVLAPTAAQTKTMINNSNIGFTVLDSVGIIYDPGGPDANYIANLNATATINYGGLTAIGFEFDFQSIDLKSGDSVIISVSGDFYFGLGNNYSTPVKKIVNTEFPVTIRFKSNGDASVGTGFKLLFRRIYRTSGAATEPDGFAGNSLVFSTRNGSLSTGNSNTVSGALAAALGSKNTASGIYSTAMGYGAAAQSWAETALGTYNTTYSPAGGSSGWNDGDRLLVIGNGASASSRSDALTLLKNGDFKIGARGTYFTNLQEGILPAGTQSGNNKKSIVLPFTNAFINAANVRVQLTPRTGNGITDVFVLGVRNITTTQCTIDIYRADASAGTGWGAAFDILWMAWE